METIKMETQTAGLFSGKVVIVTGSSSGIGRETALQFGRAGAALVIHGQNAEQLQQTEDELIKLGVLAKNVAKVLGPMEDPKTPETIIQAAIEKFGRIDVMVNNAGALIKPGLADPFSLDNFDFLYRVNLRSVIQLTQLAAPHLAKVRGNVVNISSLTGTRAFPALTYYGSLKSALDHVTRNFAQLYGSEGVRVNALCAGPIRTPAREKNGLSETKFDKYASETTVLGRIGRVSELASVVRFLASDEASYVTGAVWTVDGGMGVYTAPIDLVQPVHACSAATAEEEE